MYSFLQVTSEGLELHYHSPYPGFGPWVVGVCEEVTRSVFQHWVHFKLVETRPSTARSQKADEGDHEVRVQ